MAASTVKKRREQGLCIGCGKVPHHSRCDDCLSKHRTNPETSKRVSKRWRLALRLKAIGHYSNNSYSCRCCGEKDVRFLQIDHAANNGNTHRREISTSGPASHQVYKWLIENGFPEGYHVLCANCNMMRAIYGVCPHKLTSLPDLTGLEPAQVLAILLAQ